jgi:hypothetical protein
VIIIVLLEAACPKEIQISRDYAVRAKWQIRVIRPLPLRLSDPWKAMIAKVADYGESYAYWNLEALCQKWRTQPQPEKLKIPGRYDSRTLPLHSRKDGQSSANK